MGGNNNKCDVFTLVITAMVTSNNKMACTSSRKVHNVVLSLLGSLIPMQAEEPRMKPRHHLLSDSYYSAASLHLQ